MDTITVEDSKKSVKIFGLSECPNVDVYQNNQCYFRQRKLGLCVWYSMDPEVQRKNVEIINKYGQWKVPQFTSSCGCNDIAIRCNDFINPDWDGGTYTFGGKTPNIYYWEPICTPLPELQPQSNTNGTVSDK